MSFLHDLKIAARSLSRVPAFGLRSPSRSPWASAPTPQSSAWSAPCCCGRWLIATRIGLLYVRQSAPGIGVETPPSPSLRSRTSVSGLKTIQELGTFSEIDFTIVGLGTPREIPAGVVDGNYFEVMGLRPVLGRLLTQRRWTRMLRAPLCLLISSGANLAALRSHVLGKPVRLESVTGARSAASSASLSPPSPIQWQPRLSRTS